MKISLLSYDFLIFYLATVILKGLHKVMFDEIRPLADAFGLLLNIKDSLQSKRLLWLLGYPQCEMTCTVNSLDNFGIYGINNLDDSVICYNSSLSVDGSMSVLEVMVHNINRVESVCLMCLKQILLLSSMNDCIFDYIVSLPAFCYLYAKFIDWFKPFLDKYQNDLARNYIGDPRKKELYNETIKLYEDFMQKYNKLYGKIEIEPIENELLTGFPNTSAYIIGQTVNENSVELKKTEDFTFSCKDYSMITVPSKPTGKSNMALPRNICRDTYLFPSAVDSNSVYSCFVHSKFNYSEGFGKAKNKLESYYQY